MKFFDFLDKRPKLKGLIVIEAVDRVLAREGGDFLGEAREIHAEQREIDRRIGAGPSRYSPSRATC